MGGEMAIHGFVAPGFEQVKEAFAANFAAGLETGASFAAYRDGQPVVDIWAGFADAEKSRPWGQNTLACVFSTTKAITALAAHMVADRGLLDFDKPVAHYWPEFARAGKGSMPVRYLFSHQAGLPSVREPLPSDVFYDWERMTAALAAEAPWWEPGTANGYHAISYGFLVGEVIRRVSGLTPGRFIAQEIAAPLGADFHVGLGAEHDRRVAEMVTAPAVAMPPDSLLGKVLANPPFDAALANTRAYRAAEIPAANGHANARSCARIMAALACGGVLDGIRLLSEEAIERAIAEQCYRTDLCLMVPMRWGLGFMLTSPDLPLGPNPRTFGHGGAGGSLAVADMDARVSWAYVMNKMSATTTGDTRAASVAAALYAAI